MTAHEQLTALYALGLEVKARAERIESRERPPNVEPEVWNEALLVVLEDLWAWEEREQRKILEET